MIRLRSSAGVIVLVPSEKADRLVSQGFTRIEEPAPAPAAKRAPRRGRAKS